MGEQHRRARQRGKAWERRVAKDMGDARTGNRGTNTTDTTSEHWGVECKALDRLQLREAHLKQAITNAKDKPWVLLIQEKGTGRRVAVLDYDEFIKLTNKVKEYENER